MIENRKLDFIVHLFLSKLLFFFTVFLFLIIRKYAISTIGNMNPNKMFIIFDVRKLGC